MSASLPADMRGPQVKTPLLLLLLALAALTRTGLCQDPEEPTDTSSVSEATDTSQYTSATPANTLAPQTSTTLSTVQEATESSGSGPSLDKNPETSDKDDGAAPTVNPSTTLLDEGLGLDLVIILIPAVLVVVIIGVIVCGIFICRLRSKNTTNEELGREDPYLDGSSVEKVPMPMFEEDVPSVLELEMEELDQWMKKDGETAEEASQS